MHDDRSNPDTTLSNLFMKLEWSTMTPRERDAAVAEHIAGHKNVRKEFNSWFDIYNRGHADFMSSFNGKRTCVPNFTTDHNAAAMVKEKFYGLISFREVDGKREVLCSLEDDDGNVWPGRAGTEPEAVCIAALRSKGIKVVL